MRTSARSHSANRAASKPRLPIPSTLRAPAAYYVNHSTFQNAMADRTFKQRPISFAAGWRRNSSGRAIGKDEYRPDLSYADDTGRVLCILESTSTNDRKVGVGELCLADKFFSDAGTDGILIFSLCGKSSSPPRPDTQAAYLRPYFAFLRDAKRPHGVKQVYIISERDFERCGWEALGSQCKVTAHV